MFDWIKQLKIKIIRAEYVPTKKNMMVKDFYTKMGFSKTKLINNYEIEI